MPVPTSITDLSTTAASNSPAGVDAVFPDLDNYLRAHAAFIAQLNAADATKVAKAGDTMTGPLVLNADPSVALGAATKGYVDTGLAGKADSAHTHAWSAITSRMYGDATNDTDPNTTTEPFTLTNHANGPTGGSAYFCIWTGWWGSATYAAQVAVEVATGTPRTYTRNKASGTWYAWVRCDLGEGLTRSIGANGYAKIPGSGGLILQWGQFSHGGGGNVAVSFPLAFPAACFAASPNTQYNGGANNPSAHSKSASGFTCYWTGGATINIDYIAIGY